MYPLTTTIRTVTTVYARFLCDVVFTHRHGTLTSRHSMPHNNQANQALNDFQARPKESPD